MLMPPCTVVHREAALDFEAVSNIFSDPDKFVKADPFPFLLTALIVLVFGPGLFSIDALLKQILRRREGVFLTKTAKGQFVSKPGSGSV